MESTGSSEGVTECLYEPNMGGRLAAQKLPWVLGLGYTVLRIDVVLVTNYAAA